MVVRQVPFQFHIRKNIFHRKREKFFPVALYQWRCIYTKKKTNFYFVTKKIVIFKVLCIDSRATIVWQDGVEEKDIPTTQLYYSVSLDDHEFFPGEWVVAEGEKEDGDLYGAIQFVNYLERTATVSIKEKK